LDQAQISTSRFFIFEIKVQNSLDFSQYSQIKLVEFYPAPFLAEPKAWECGYFTREIAKGFGQIYDNVNGVADDFAQLWKILAQRY